jgi:hypothetical protein
MDVEDGVLLSSTEPPLPPGPDRFPPFTVWEHRRVLGCIPASCIPAIETYFIGHWEVHPLMPLLVTSLVIASFCTFLATAVPEFPPLEQFLLFPLISLIAFLFLWAYWRMLATGPGYYPFYWGWAQQTGYHPPDDR